MKHTKGKWNPKSDGTWHKEGFIVKSEHGISIALVFEGEHGKPKGEEAKANKALIEAAPELLEALQDEVEFLSGLFSDGLQMAEVHKSTIRARIIVLIKEIKKATEK